MDIVIVVLSLVIIYLLYLLSKANKEKKLKEQVAWVLEEQSLLWHILSEQHRVPEKYRLTEDEKDLASSYLREFRASIAERYVLSRITPIRGKYSIDGNHFFFYMLFSYTQANDPIGASQKRNKVVAKLSLISNRYCVESKPIRSATTFLWALDPENMDELN